MCHNIIFLRVKLVLAVKTSQSAVAINQSDRSLSGIFTPEKHSQSIQAEKTAPQDCPGEEKRCDGRKSNHAQSHNLCSNIEVSPVFGADIGFSHKSERVQILRYT